MQGISASTEILKESPEVMDKIYTPSGIFVQGISRDMCASFAFPCRHHYGAGKSGVFTCLHPTENHAHVLTLDGGGWSIFPACIESVEFLADVLNGLVSQQELTGPEKDQFYKNEKQRIQKYLKASITNHEKDTLRSTSGMAAALTPLHIVLDPAD